MAEGVPFQKQAGLGAGDDKDGDQGLSLPRVAKDHSRTLHPSTHTPGENDILYEHRGRCKETPRSPPPNLPHLCPPPAPRCLVSGVGKVGEPEDLAFIARHLGPPTSGPRKGGRPPEPAAAFGAITAYNVTRILGVTAPRFARAARPSARKNGLAPRHAASQPQIRHRNPDASSARSLTILPSHNYQTHTHRAPFSRQRQTMIRTQYLPSWGSSFGRKKDIKRMTTNK